MVSSALDECISHYLCGERTLEQKLSSIREDMKSEHSLRETKDPALQIVDTFYHQIERYPVAGNLLILLPTTKVYKKILKNYFTFKEINIVLLTGY